MPSVPGSWDEQTMKQSAQQTTKILLKSATMMLNEEELSGRKKQVAYRRCASNVERTLKAGDGSSLPSSTDSYDSKVDDGNQQLAQITVVRTEDAPSSHHRGGLKKSLSNESLGSNRSALSANSNATKRGILRSINSPKRQSEKGRISINVPEDDERAQRARNIRNAFIGADRNEPQAQSASDLTKLEEEPIPAHRPRPRRAGYESTRTSIGKADGEISPSNPRMGYQRMATWGYNRARGKSATFSRGASQEFPPPGLADEHTEAWGASTPYGATTPGVRSPPMSGYASASAFGANPVDGATGLAPNHPLSPAALYGASSMLPSLDAAANLATLRALHATNPLAAGMPPAHGLGATLPGLGIYDSHAAATQYLMLNHLAALQKQYWQESAAVQASFAESHSHVAAHHKAGSSPVSPRTSTYSRRASEKRGGQSRLTPPSRRTDSNKEKRQVSNASMASTSVPTGEEQLSPMGSTNNTSAENKESEGGDNKPNPPAKDFAATAVTPDSDKTTIMLRHIPNNMTESKLVERLTAEGFGPHTYDFLHLPKDSRTKSNMGYAFLNLVCAETAAGFIRTIHGCKLGSAQSEKIAEVTYARIQGKARNIKLHRKKEGKPQQRQPNGETHNEKRGGQVRPGRNDFSYRSGNEQNNQGRFYPPGDHRQFHAGQGARYMHQGGHDSAWRFY